MWIGHPGTYPSEAVHEPIPRVGPVTLVDRDARAGGPSGKVRYGTVNITRANDTMNVTWYDPFPQPIAGTKERV